MEDVLKDELRSSHFIGVSRVFDAFSRGMAELDLQNSSREMISSATPRPFAMPAAFGAGASYNGSL